MVNSGNNNSLLALLEDFVMDNEEDIAREVADNFRRRRVEKNISRKRIAEKSGVPLSTVARFEQKGLISLESLIRLAMALGYASDVRHLFGEAKYNTMAELDQVKSKLHSKRAYPKSKPQ